MSYSPPIVELNESERGREAVAVFVECLIREAISRPGKQYSLIVDAPVRPRKFLTDPLLDNLDMLTRQSQTRCDCDGLPMILHAAAGGGGPEGTHFATKIQGTVCGHWSTIHIPHSGIAP
jgi:hypothetical protein